MPTFLSMGITCDLCSEYAVSQLVNTEDAADTRYYCADHSCSCNGCRGSHNNKPCSGCSTHLLSEPLPTCDKVYHHAVVILSSNSHAQLREIFS